MKKVSLVVKVKQYVLIDRDQGDKNEDKINQGEEIDEDIINIDDDVSKTISSTHMQ